jgi:shikimate dehydrogenase
MAGGSGEHDLAFAEDAVREAGTVLDVVALPPETPLVRLARSLGKQVLTGDEIMLRQALEQFVMYTGVRPTDEQVARAEAYASGA